MAGKKVIQTPSIAVLIQARNKDPQLKECVKSAKLLTDKIVINNQQVEYVEELRAKAITIIDAEWIFLLDADERMTRGLAQEIKREIKDGQFTSYKIPRKNIFGKKKWLK